MLRARFIILDKNSHTRLRELMEHKESKIEPQEGNKTKLLNDFVWNFTNENCSDSSFPGQYYR